MRTDPPNGEELDRLLAGMKAEVMARVAQEQPAERRALTDRILASILAAALLLGLGSAGAAIALGALPLAGDDDTPAAGGSPAVLPTASPRYFPVETEAPSRPTSRLGVTCEQVVVAEDLLAFLGDVGSPVTGPASDPSRMADAAALEQLGALTCTWSNGADPSLPDTGGQDATLTVLPEGLAAAAEYVELYQSADPTYGPAVQGPRCVANPMGFCELVGVIGSTWVEFRVRGAHAESLSDDELRTRFLSLTDPLVRVLSAVEPAPRWDPGAASPVAAASCDDLAPAPDLAAVIGEPDLDTGARWDGPRVGQYAYAADQTGAVRCHVGFASSDATFAQVGVLPNGAWGVDRYRDGWLADGGEVIAFDAATDGTAVLRCADDSRSCRFDAVVSGDWVSVSASPVRGGEYEPTAQIEASRAHIVDIAAIVAQRVRDLDG
ncbi:hypothetical protein [Agromyces binzhouensis]|uniref:DUF3558 domain-containing protein n=1 Tax=Agromyces binzhouensis TaxID=1817495 RepID=A0A4Q2JMK3_9MICO|nr:hypothetical protein [Agromyces binzhouensis]RXZ47138.1 hypothetical protein ESO86_09145 [Agromyces binzhouensis]